jgi:hypothetical protein
MGSFSDAHPALLFPQTKHMVWKHGNRRAKLASSSKHHRLRVGATLGTDRFGAPAHVPLLILFFSLFLSRVFTTSCSTTTLIFLKPRHKTKMTCASQSHTFLFSLPLSFIFPFFYRLSDNILSTQSHYHAADVCSPFSSF